VRKSFPNVRRENVTARLTFGKDFLTRFRRLLIGWNSDLTSVKEETNLSQACIDYVQFLEDKLGTRVSMVSTGPDREELVVR